MAGFIFVMVAGTVNNFYFMMSREKKSSVSNWSERRRLLAPLAGRPSSATAGFLELLSLADIAADKLILCIAACNLSYLMKTTLDIPNLL